MRRFGVILATATAAILLAATVWWTTAARNAGEAACYSSPQAVFDVFRESRENGEWGKCLACLSPRSRKELIFEAYFACAMANSAQSRAILNEFDVDEASLDQAFEEKLERRGRDAGSQDSTAEKQLTPNGAPSDQHRELLRDVVYERIRDKPAFYAAVHGRLQRGVPVPPLGDLEHLSIDGDVASGRAKMTISHLESDGVGPDQVVSDVFYKPFKFRRVNGCWWIE